MSTTTAPQTIAFFGATGGCALAVLTRVLQSSTPYHAIALARTPSKLTDLLLSKGVPQSAIDNRLTIIAGNVKNEEEVKRALTVRTSASGAPQIVDKIVCGIGGAPAWRFHYIPLTLTDPEICASATATILSALTSLQSSQRDTKRPLIAQVSTTGISARGRDVPWAFWALYHWFLHVPHVDKKVAEQLLSESDQQFCVVRASLLMDGDAKPLEGIREGWELPAKSEGKGQHAGGAPGPAVGYTITRESVGEWMYRRLVEGSGWEGRMVTITE